MATLFEIVNDMIGDDTSQYLTPQQIKNVDSEIKLKLKNRLGNKSYNELETYITNNKDDKYLKSLATLILMNLGGLSQAMKHANVDLEKIEVVLGYRMLFSMYEILQLSSYDSERAILER